MGKVEITLPAMGEGIIEATITKWLVAVGDEVSEDQSLVEVATDKVDSEIPSPSAGKVKELLFSEGDVPQVGQTIAVLEVEQDGEGALEQNTASEPTPQKEPAEDQPKRQEVATNNKKEVGSHPHTSPLVRTIAKREGISTEELANVSGTGLNGRITRDDILAYVEKRSAVIEKPKPQAQQPSTQSQGHSVEVIPMDRMRKLIADHMVMSKQTSAHVTSFIEADVTNLVRWRNSEKEAFQKREGQKLTLTPLFVEAAIKALKDYPLVNSSIDGDNILMKRDINIGLAAALPNGNLIVPVIKNANNLNLAGLAEKVNDLAARARNNKLQPDEIQGGTFTITNLGMFETLTGTPIINQPQVAILAIGAITKKVVVLESEQGDTMAIRQMAMLSLSYDHRVIDGALGGMFLKAVRDYIQDYK
jgi:2-oxoglutarate dehydrogenase E2 component (dihydrolipoamide succinyltransferase)